MPINNSSKGLSIELEDFMFTGMFTSAFQEVQQEASSLPMFFQQERGANIFCITALIGGILLAGGALAVIIGL